MKNFIKFIGFTLGNGNFLTLVAVIMFADLFAVCVKSMLQVGVTVGDLAFAAISLLCAVVFVAIGVFLAVKDWEEFKDTKYRRRVECLINSSEWAKI